mgnify:CR=1 FL=1
MRTPVLLLIPLLALAGCATSKSKFACPHPQGVTCMSATDVYTATNQADEVRGIDPGEARALAREGKSAGEIQARYQAVVETPDEPLAVVRDHRRVVGATLEGDTLVITGVSDPERRAAPARYAPVAPAPARSAGTLDGAMRVSAQILRIHVRPWEDERGDLHLGGEVLTEITPRRWSVAKPVQPQTNVFSLLEAPQAQPAASPSLPGATPGERRTDPSVAQPEKGN